MKMGLTIDDFIAGWIGGICGVIVGHPLDTMKVRQQTLGTTMFVAVRRTFKYERIRGFFKGMLFPLLAVGPSNAVFFGVYGNVINVMQQTSKRNHDISITDQVAIRRVYVAGVAGGVFQVLITCPFEYIKTILQTRTGGRGSWKKHYEVPYTGSIDALLGIVRDRGFRGLFRGVTPMMLRDVPTSGLYTLTYEMLMYYNFSKCETPVLVKQSIAGGSAGVASWMFVIPLDVVKSRIQADNPANPVYRGMVDCFYKSYKSHGFSVFFRGAPAILVRTFLVNAVVFIGYEATLAAAR
ncbi:solute carrier family 25 member 45-like [Tenebrio molitor]|uniref:solute carrier family 25 member 45-like n=1 Tax=Tenebrio molitor TaxID=7067 RepID=UPI003624A8C5